MTANRVPLKGDDSRKKNESWSVCVEWKQLLCKRRDTHEEKDIDTDKTALRQPKSCLGVSSPFFFFFLLFLLLSYVVFLPLLRNQPFSPWIQSKCEKKRAQRHAGWVLRTTGLKKYVYIYTFVSAYPALAVPFCVCVFMCVCVCVCERACAYKVTRLIVCGLPALMGAVVSCWWMSVSVRSMMQLSNMSHCLKHEHMHAQKHTVGICTVSSLQCRAQVVEILLGRWAAHRCHGHHRAAFTAAAPNSKSSRRPTDWADHSGHRKGHGAHSNCRVKASDMRSELWSQGCQWHTAS